MSLRILTATKSYYLRDKNLARKEVMEEKSIIPSLMSAVLNQPGTSHSIEITEINENQLSPSKEQSDTLNKLLNDGLTYDEYTKFIGEDSENEEEEEEEELPEEGFLAVSIIDKPPESPVKKKSRRPRSNLPVALQGLMGEANLRYARGENDIAEKICFEIIRQVPTSSLPFQTLAQIYETEDPEKSLQFSLIACHLSPNNPEEWMRFANISIEKKDYKQALVCLTKAVNADFYNVNYHLLRLEMCTELGDIKYFLKAGMRFLNALKPEHTDLIVKYSQKLAEGFFKLGVVEKARASMDHLFQKCPNSVTVGHVNRMIEVLLSCKQYERILEILVEFCSFQLEAEKQTYERTDGTVEENLIVLNYHIPPEIPIDIHAKFLVCLIHMKLENLTPQIETETAQFSTEQHGDLLFDIAEAFMQENLHLQAFAILDKLVRTEKFSMAAVWLRHAECLQVCRKFTEAIESYKQVIELAPQLGDVRMTLSTLLREQGRVNEAIVTLDQEVSVEELDPNVLITRCKLLRQHSKYKEYIRDAFLLLSKHCTDDMLIHELAVIEPIEIPENMYSRLYPPSEVFIKDAHMKIEKQTRAERRELIDQTLLQDWKIFKDIINISYLSKEYNLMQRICQAAMQSKRFQKDYKKDLEFLVAISCLYSNDSYNGYNVLRVMIINDLHNMNIWNCFNAIVQNPEDSRIIRFIIRLLARFQMSNSLHIMHGNNCLLAGTYKYALSEYTTTFKQEKTPLLAFMIAVTLVQMACQKNTAKKHSLVVQSHAFLTVYQKMRGEDLQHEVYYNFGRASHQLGLFPLAIHYYKKVLRFDSRLLRVKTRNTLDLKREAAFNLSLCYKSSGAKNLALMYLRKYIVI